MKKYYWILLLLSLVLISFPVLAADHQLPYNETFNDITSGWEISSDKDGSSGYVDDGYEININKTGVIRSADLPVSVPDSYIVQIKMKINSGDGAYGLIFNRGGSGCIYIINPSQQNYQVAQMNGKDVDMLQDGTKSDAINTDDYNVLKVEVQKKQARVYVNDSLLYNFSIRNPADTSKLSIIAKSFSDDTVIHVESFSATKWSDEGNDNADVKTVNFSSPNQGFAQTEYFKVQNGVYSFVGGDSDSLYWEDFSQSVSSDFTAQVKVRWESGNKADGFGLIFRLTDNHEYYVFWIAPNGGYQLLKKSNNKLNSIIDWQQTDTIKSGFNLLKVTCKGRSIKCYLNNYSVINITDDQPSGAKFSVGVVAGGSLKCSFDDFSIAADFSNYANNKTVDFSSPDQGFRETNVYKIQNGVYSFIGAESRFYQEFFSQPIPADFTAQVRAKWDGGADNNGFGLIFRIRDNDNYYVFQISANGQYNLAKLVNNKWEYPANNWQETDLIKPGFNTLKVTCEGETIKCFLNNHLVINVRDEESYSDNIQVGVGTNGIKCSFDDFRVSWN